MAFDITFEYIFGKNTLGNFADPAVGRIASFTGDEYKIGAFFLGLFFVTLNYFKNINEKIFIKYDVVKHSNQPVIYQECIDKNKDLDWILLSDCDEFLWLKEGTIKDFLSKFSEDTCTILINWLVYGTSNLEKYDNNKTVFNQFTLREEYGHFWNIFVKSFVRPKLIKKFGNVHVTYNKKYKVCNIYGNNITEKA